MVLLFECFIVLPYPRNYKRPKDPLRVFWLCVTLKFLQFNFSLKSPFHFFIFSLMAVRFTNEISFSELCEKKLAKIFFANLAFLMFSVREKSFPSTKGSLWIYIRPRKLTWFKLEEKIIVIKINLKSTSEHGILTRKK